MTKKDPFVIKVNLVIDSNSAISRLDGEKIFAIIKSKFEKKEPVKLDFSGIDIVITAFLNAAIGQLYNEFEEDFIKNYIQVDGLEINDKMLLKLVVETAKKYFSDKTSFKKSTKNFLT